MARSLSIQPKLICGFLLAFSLTASQFVSADSVSFLVDPATIDANGDGFITGTEFNPIGTDGVIFGLIPTNNLVGTDRFLLSDITGLQYGGGGGSTLSFDFTVSEDISLESYTLGPAGTFLNNPLFDIMEGATVLSSLNTSIGSGDTHSFEGGPLQLAAGTTYSFETQVSGAAVQSFMGSWTYSATSVPEPGTFGAIVLAGLGVALRRRK